MSIRGVIEYKGLHPGNTVRELKRAIKFANFKTVEAWHESFLPEHFTTGAVRKYGYTPRDAPYMRRKAKRRGHQRPLEYTGEGKRNATRQIVVSGTSKGAKGRLPGTQVFNFKRSAASPDMRAELLATTKAEEKTLAEVHRIEVGKHLNSVKSNKKVRA